MKKMLLLATLMTTSVLAIEEKNLLPLIEVASTNRQSVYMETRDKIMGYGVDAIPLLGTIAVDKTLPWQQRLVARICYERIERKEDIEKLLDTDWYNHPKFDPEWWKPLPGPEAPIGSLVVPELKKAGLWYYCLELVWKGTDEEGKIRKNCFDDFWARWCVSAVKDNIEERVWFLRACADLMETSPTSTRVEWLSSTLRNEWKIDSTYVLDHRAPPPALDPPFRLGTRIIKEGDAGALEEYRTKYPSIPREPKYPTSPPKFLPPDPDRPLPPGLQRVAPPASN